MPVTTIQYREMLTRCNQRPAISRGALPDLESDLHDAIIKFCREQPQPWVCFHSRMDKRQHSNVGMPDFVIVTHTGAVWFIEAKRRLGKCTPAQNATLVWLRNNRARAEVVRSLEEFKAFVNEHTTPPT